MPLHFTSGDLLDSTCMALVSPVNCVGVAGAGLAKQFKDRWPRQVAEYAAFCRAGKMAPGVLHEALLPDGRSIVSVPTKRHWRDESRLSDVYSGINTLAEYCRDAGIPSMAIPALGCGLGGLPKHLVLNAIKLKMHDLQTEVWLYGFEGSASPRR
ncbi:macro domain-containing protein [Streptomyces sp. NEAU-Y11]|uniref:macro domain-containing protein n=1 Tax=Streptomyces cucumeris TaxID=2962890 RepID=UPI0020C8704C|nr:macro domain-containing protein [Streptomyces sp. NEAU-Y11]MCP9209595.1 macro domain-containing protein [Streptomyces sp. NEAU-Y11]